MVGGACVTSSGCYIKRIVHVVPSRLLQLKSAKIRHCAAFSGKRSTCIRRHARLAFILNLFTHRLSFVWFQLYWNPWKTKVPIVLFQ